MAATKSNCCGNSRVVTRADSSSRCHRLEKRPIPPSAAAGIAVLPFENLSNDREDASFADGVQDDLLTKLAKIADLKVISRTSVMGYRGKQNTRQIGNELGVSHVLEGSVRRQGVATHKCPVDRRPHGFAHLGGGVRS